MRLLADGPVSDMLAGTPIPRMFHARQSFPGDSVAREDIPGLVCSLLSEGRVGERVAAGMRIGIAVGSRGICGIDVIARAIADYVRSRGAHPFVFPAMGSHGGMTARGQRDVLASLGVTEEAVGCPVVSSMETVEVGVSAQGIPVHMDRNAWDSDGVIVTCRVKPHTSFRGKVGSGICKMLSVGMGKQAGASAAHARGIERMADTVVDMAEVIINSGKVLFALPCVENAYGEIAHLEAVLPEAVLGREPELLQVAFANMPRIIVGSCDVLVVDEIGKNYGGTGADPNITGRFPTPHMAGGVQAERIAFLKLSEASHGNAMGCGLSDAITQRLLDSIDFEATYANCLTSRVLESARLPCVLPSDERAVQFCIRTCAGEADPSSRRIVRIANTLEIEDVMLSESYYEAVRAGEYEGLQALDAPEPLVWDATGVLTTPVLFAASADETCDV